MCIYKNIAYKLWETDTPHCKGPDSNQGIVHTAPSAQSQVQQEKKANRTFGKLLYAKKTQPKKTTKTHNVNYTIYLVSLVQTAKGGRRMPGSNGCPYGNFLTWSYQDKKEQFCDVMNCFEGDGNQLLPVFLGAMQ